MRNILIVIFIFFSLTNINAQLKLQDSTVNVIAYWDLNEQHEYSVTLQKLIKDEKDTILNELITYNVLVTVIDSTEKNYVVRWQYKDHKTNSTNEILKKIMEETGSISVDIITDQNGQIEGIKNWEEVSDYVNGGVQEMFKSVPQKAEVGKIVDPILAAYKTKAGVEATSIQDAQQAYAHHGFQYKLNEPYIAVIDRENFLTKSKKPLKATVNITLEEMNEEDNNYVIRNITQYDPEQMTDFLYEFMNELAENVGQKKTDRKDVPQMRLTIESVSTIHNTGWIIDSTQWKESSTGNTTQVEIRKIVLEK
jgi:hypothetical protein